MTSVHGLKDMAVGRASAIIAIAGMASLVFAATALDVLR
jgi:hypothetical protein